MSADDEAPAAQRFWEIAELVEMVLLEIPTRELLQMHRINGFVNATIDTSSKLKSKLFLKQKSVTRKTAPSFLTRQNPGLKIIHLMPSQYNINTFLFPNVGSSITFRLPSTPDILYSLSCKATRDLQSVESPAMLKWVHSGFDYSLKCEPYPSGEQRSAPMLPQVYTKMGITDAAIPVQVDVTYHMNQDQQREHEILEGTIHKRIARVELPEGASLGDLLRWVDAWEDGDFSPHIEHAGVAADFQADYMVQGGHYSSVKISPHVWKSFSMRDSTLGY